MRYAEAGVDISRAEEAKERIRRMATRTFTRGVVGGIGAFGGLFALDVKRWREPVLVSSTDGVGTKPAARSLAVKPLSCQTPMRPANMTSPASSLAWSNAAASPRRTRCTPAMFFWRCRRSVSTPTVTHWRGS